MSDGSEKAWFDGVDSVVSEPLRFKAKLAIGEDAYTSLRVKNAVFETWEAAGAVTSVVAVAQSSAIASTFFAPSGFLGLLGIGTAVTPIGWVIAAGAITGGAYLGVTRYLKQNVSSRVTVIPEFINTPMDVLAVGLFDLLAPLALKMAEIDGYIDPAERVVIKDHFVKGWGYDAQFVDEGIKYVESKLPGFSVKELAQTLAEFKKANPDCNYGAMSKEIISFLKEVMEADGIVDEREEMAIEKVQSIFQETGRFSALKLAKGGLETVTKKAGKLIESGML